MNTQTYQWIIDSLSDDESCLNTNEMKDNRSHLVSLISNTENLPRELGGTHNPMNDYHDNIEILRTQNNINSSTHENIQ